MIPLSRPDQIYGGHVAVVEAWNLEYRGDAYKVLIKAIDDVYTQIGSQCGKIIPVTQGSGTGKSKTMKKVGEERIMFSLCLREDLGKKYFGL
jgi:hypothetical protein